MAWNPRTWLFGETITAAKLNEIRDLLNACAPAKVSGAGQIPVATAANVLAGLAAPTASLLALVSAINENEKMEWGNLIRGAAVNRTTLQTASGSSMTMTMVNELFDTDGFVDLSSNSDRITIPTGLDGVYLIGGYIYFENDDTTDDWDRGFEVDPVQGSGSAIVFETKAQAVFQSIHGGSSGYDNEPDRMTVIGLAGLSAGNYLRHYSWAGNTGTVDRQGSMWAIRLCSLPS